MVTAQNGVHFYLYTVLRVSQNYYGVVFARGTNKHEDNLYRIVSQSILKNQIDRSIVHADNRAYVNRAVLDQLIHIITT